MFQQVRQLMPVQDEGSKLESKIETMMKILMEKFDQKDREQQQKDLQHRQEIQTLQTQIGQLSTTLSNV